MEKSEQINELAKALVEFQKNVPAIEKRRTANVYSKEKNVSYSYKFADLSDIWSAIRKPLADAKLAVTQPMNGGSNGITYIHTIVWHESGQYITSVMEISTDRTTPQQAGSLFTYYKRYALAAALGISTEEDDDGNAAGEVKQKAKPKEVEHQTITSEDGKKHLKMTDRQMLRIRDLMRELGHGEEKITYILDRMVTAEKASAQITAFEKELETKKEKQNEQT